MVKRSRLSRSGEKLSSSRLDAVKKKKEKNIYLEYEEFIQNQIDLNPKKDLNRHWDGWSELFLASKLRRK